MSGKNSITYNSIDILPVRSFDRYAETRDGRYLESDGIFRDKNYDEIWNKLEDEIIDRIGVDDKSKEKIKAVNNLLYYKLEYAINKDEKTKNTINKCLRILTRLEKDEGGEAITISQQLVRISTILEFRLNPNEVTMSEFFEYSNEAKQLIKSRKNTVNE